MMEVQKELEQASEQLRNNNESSSRVLSLTSGCELFTRFVTRTFLDIPDFDKCKKALIERGEKFTHMTVTARNRISRHAEHFIHDGNVVFFIFLLLFIFIVLFYLFLLFYFNYFFISLFFIYFLFYYLFYYYLFYFFIYFYFIIYFI